MSLLALAAVFACKLNTDLDQAVAIEVILPDSGRVEVTDTFRPRARALNGVGDSVAAEIFWSALDTTVLALLDSTTGEFLAQTVGTGRIQARVGTLRSNPQPVTVLAQDSSAATTFPARGSTGTLVRKNLVFTRPVTFVVESKQ